MQLATLSPHLAGLHLTEITVIDGTITLQVRPTARTATCPLCHSRSRCVRSAYTRTLADLPWGGLPVRLLIRIRRFTCANLHCPQRIFAERLPHLTAPYARQTHLRRVALQRIGMALGGNAGVRLAVPLGIPTSRPTLLRLVRATPIPAGDPPRIVGIDEWAWRRGKHYGTILVDLEAHRPLDLLPERSAPSAAAWLRDHPEITLVCRDRSGLYADAATTGAPGAIQVADRFHLQQNLGDALERFLLRKGACLREAAKATSEAVIAAQDALVPPQAMYRGRRRGTYGYEQRMEEASLQRHARRVAAYERVHALRAAGADIADVARSVGVSRETVYRYLRMAHPPERKHPKPRRKVLDPYLPYLLRRWDEGCHDGMRLWREVRALGFTASSSTVSRLVAGLRRGLPRPQRSALLRVAGPSARQVTLLFMRRPEDRSTAQSSYLTYLCQGDAAIATAYALTQEFGVMVRERQGERLSEWMAAAIESNIIELRGFARGLASDLAAVRAGLTLIHSNGQTEGQINRLKMLKRQMYGRANIDLLRQRVLFRA
jgi:transposase